MPSPRPLDRIDRQLLALLQNDARRTNKELAAAVGLAPSTCLGRVQRLERDGVLRGFHADVDPAALGVGIEAMVALRLARLDGGSHDALWSHLREREEVLDVFHVSGGEDLLVHVVARDTVHLRELVMDDLANRDEVGHVQTSLIFEHVRAHEIPSWERAPA